MFKMARYNRTDHMKSIHSSRKAQTQRKVDEAIQKLVRAKGKINFNSVASLAGVAKATLYNHSDIRERIETLRDQQANVSHPEMLKYKMDQNNKDAIIASLQRKIKKIEKENKELREQLKMAYGEIYKKI